MAGGRTGCCIIFCRRTIATEKLYPDNEWICQNHWRGVPARLKKLYRKAYRVANNSPKLKDYYRVMRLWQKCKETATMRGL